MCSGQEGLREVVDTLAENTSIKKAIAVIEDQKEDHGNAEYISYTLVLVLGVSGIGLYTSFPMKRVTIGAPLEGLPYSVLYVWVETKGDPLVELEKMLEKAGFTIEQTTNM